ncbi:glycoside hydrolase family 27 protein [Acidomyces richmondensis BFW]|nr:MAG: glycoside hydrolase family 27 protein [Acidomyces sp. 'richmondensis']KYG41159.1 glycoside hydrolase family 27 protein [Acidomyces richmondensis BFW]
MGYDTYNAFACNYNGEIATAQAKAMNETGLVAVGYTTFILDDCYMQLERNATGYLQENLTQFPEGMVQWTKGINQYGISGSAYSSNGYKTCAGYPGGYGHEEKDLEVWRSWGWHHMLKYDNCYIPYDNITMQNEYGRYKRMLDFINAQAAKYNEKPLIYALCQWGWENPYNWAFRISQSWRIDGDIKPFWSSIASIIYQQSINYLSTGHYAHNDMDMLEVGNNGQGTPVGNLTIAEQRSHFTAWALLKSPLLIGTDLRNATRETIEILGNKEIIDINQDPHEGAALAPFRIGLQPDYQWLEYNASYPPPYWGGNSSYGVVFMIINTMDTKQEMGFNLTENWAIRAGRQYNVRDLWKHEHVGIAIRNWTVTLESHDVAALLMTDAGPEPAEELADGEISPPCAWPFLALQCTSPNGSYIYNGSIKEYGF